MLKHQYEVHPAATLFPQMTDEEFRGLKADIQVNGQREDIVVWCGKLIDGRHRLKACLELNINPSIAELDEDQDPWKYVISHNLHRRHLTTSQRAMVAGKLATLKEGRPSKETVSNDTVSLDEAAKQLNIGRATAARGKTVQERGSESVKQAVEQGKVPVSLAAKLVKQIPDKREQSKIISKGVEEVRATVTPKMEVIEYEDAKDEDEEETEQPKADIKLEEFKRLWSKCSDISKAAIRAWVNNN